MRKPLIGMVVLLAMALGASTARAGNRQKRLSSGITTYSDHSFRRTELHDFPFQRLGVFLRRRTHQYSQGVRYLIGMELMSQIICVSGGCAPLKVDFSGTGFTTVALGFFTTDNMLAENGSTSSTTQTGWYDTSDAHLGMGGTIGSVGFSGTTSGSKTASGGGPASSYSLTVQDVFNSGSGEASFSADGYVGATPEPRTMLLFGSGFAGVRRNSPAATARVIDAICRQREPLPGGSQNENGRYHIDAYPQRVFDQYSGSSHEPNASCVVRFHLVGYLPRSTCLSSADQRLPHLWQRYRRRIF